MKLLSGSSRRSLNTIKRFCYSMNNFWNKIKRFWNSMKRMIISTKIAIVINPVLSSCNVLILQYSVASQVLRRRRRDSSQITNRAPQS